MLSTDNWCLKVAEKVYGPYTTDQLEAFAREGRLSAQSMIAPAGGKNWRPAKNYPNILRILEGKTTSRKTTAFGKQTPGTDSAVLADGEIANFILVFDVVSGAASRLEHIIRNIGPAFRLTDNVWTVASTQSVMGIKNTIAPHLQVREPVLVVDASRGRTAWQNFVPELHSRLTKALTRRIAA